MNKLTPEQRDWLIQQFKDEEQKYTLGCITCNTRLYPLTIIDIIEKCTEDENEETNT